MERISSRENERVKVARKLATSGSFRAENGLFFAEGKRLCFDLAQSLRPKVAFFTEKFLKQNPQVQRLAIENFLISEPVDDKLSQTKSPQGMYCLFETPKNTLDAIRYNEGVLVCETLQNPENAGAVLRSAAAFGFGGVVFAENSVDPFSPKALRASMGAVGRVPVAWGASIPAVSRALKDKGCTLYATALNTQAVALTDTTPAAPFALLIGNEGAGLSEQAIELADKTVYIPMQNGMESLNAAVAASVAMFYFKQMKS